MDKQTRKSIAYASIKLKNNKLQSIANTDGCYTLTEKFLTNDSVVISCVGYKSRILSVKALKLYPRIELDPLIYQLNDIDITSKGNTDYPYQIFNELCKKYRNYSLTQNSKGYFCFLSLCGGLPLEMVEEYFNSNVSCKNGISKLMLKNGRLGSSNSKFYSLSTTDFLTNFSLFSLSGNQDIPSTPGNFSYHGIKKFFDLKIIKVSLENEDKKLILEFHPKTDTSNLFSGYVWIDKSNNTIEKLEYHIFLNNLLYLHPAIHDDKVDSIELDLMYVFDNSNNNNPTLSSVSLDYSLLYFSKHLSNTIKISSEGFLLFYDYSNPFLEEIPLGLIAAQENDYQKIACLPYDSIFWVYPGITPQNEKQKQFIDYFQRNGFLMNFSKTLDSLTGANYIHWNASSDILYSDLLNRPPVVHVSSNGVTSFNIKNPTSYDIDCRILLNPVKIADSIHLNSCTLLNRSTSYYFLEHGYKAAVFINLTFDLFEKKRRKIIANYNQFSKSHKATFDDIQSIYNNELVQLKDTIKTFQNETQNGKNSNALLKWYKYINLKTGIDRSALIKKFLEEEINSR